MIYIKDSFYLEYSSSLNGTKLDEYTYRIQRDVDDIYKKYFKNVVHDLQTSDKPMMEIVKKHAQTVSSDSDIMFGKISSSQLVSKDCKEANSVNGVAIKCGIFLKRSSNYNPGNLMITINLAPSLFGYLFSYLDYKISFMDAIEKNLNKSEQQRALNDISENRVKGTIAHELTHWISDSLNNRHITNMIKRASASEYQAMGKRIVTQGHIDVAATDYETNAQIANIKQIYRKYKKDWKTFSLLDIISLNVSLMAVANVFIQHNNTSETKGWLQYLMKRLEREGIGSPKLGDFSMTDFRNRFAQ